MADIRIKDLGTTAASAASDDYLAVDGVTNATRKILASKFVAAPGTTTDNAIARYDGTAGQTQNSGCTIDDSNNLTVPGVTINLGLGGTGTNNAIVTINGSSASSYGAQLRFNRNSVQKWDMGHHSGIQGGSSDDLLIYNQTAGNESLRIAASTGNLKFGAYGAGALTTDSSGNVTATSDERAKTNLQPFTKGLAQVVRLTPKSYKWKAETGLNTDDAVVSLTAQDLLAAGLGEAVNTERTVPVMESVQVDGKTVQRQRRNAQGVPMFERVAADYYTVSDRAVIAALVNAVKELASEVAELKAR